MSKEKANDTGACQEPEQNVDVDKISERTDDSVRWYGRMTWLGSYCRSNLLFVRLLAFLLVGLVTSVVTMKMWASPKPVSLGDLPRRFAKYILQAYEVREPKKKEKKTGSQGRKAHGKQGRMGRKKRRVRERGAARRRIRIRRLLQEKTLGLGLLALQGKGISGIIAGDRLYGKELDAALKNIDGRSVVRGIGGLGRRYGSASGSASGGGSGGGSSAFGRRAGRGWGRGKSGSGSRFRRHRMMLRDSGGIAQFRRQHPWGHVRLFAYRMGVGSENVTLLRQLTRKSGAVYNCLGRTALPRCAVAHTRPAMLLEQVKVEGIGATETLVGGRQTHLFPGAWVTIASRFVKNGNVRIVLKGRYAGRPKKLVFSFPVEPAGDLAPRAWAELAIQQLTALHSPTLTKLIVAYAQHFRIPNRHCSFLILETDKEYKQYGLEEQKKSKQANDVERFLTVWHQEHTQPTNRKQRWLSLFRRGLKRSRQLQTSTGRSILSLLQKIPSSSFVFRATMTRTIWYRHQVSRRYLKRRMNRRYEFSPFTQEARRRLRKSTRGAIRCLSSIVERHPGTPQALRLVGYYLMAGKRPEQAARIFLRVLERRSYEPHSYRDLARSLIKMKRLGLASALYEMILVGEWDSRFGRIKTIAREEYALLVQQISKVRMSALVRAHLLQRRALLGLEVQCSKLRITVTWNTDNTDIDLWVHEPNGEICSYNRRRTRNGTLLDDITRGYGPERYESVGGARGRYTIRLHFYGNNGNTLGNETHVSVLIVTNAGTSKQRVREKHIVLRRNKEYVTVARLKI